MDTYTHSLARTHTRIYLETEEFEHHAHSNFNTKTKSFKAMQHVHIKY